MPSRTLDGEPLPLDLAAVELSEDTRQEVIGKIDAASEGSRARPSEHDWHLLNVERAIFVAWETYRKEFFREEQLSDLHAAIRRAKRMARDLAGLSDLALAQMLFDADDEAFVCKALQWRRALAKLAAHKPGRAAPALESGSDRFEDFLEAWWRRISGSEPTLRHDDQESHYHHFLHRAYEGLGFRVGLTSKAVSARRKKRDAAKNRIADFATALRRLREDRG